MILCLLLKTYHDFSVDIAEFLQAIVEGQNFSGANKSTGKNKNTLNLEGQMFEKIHAVLMDCHHKIISTNFISKGYYFVYHD